MDSYRTLATSGQALFTEKRSKFLAFAFPVATESEAAERIATLRKQYHDARHVCYAYVLAYDGSETRSNDDGEPSSSAGRPILGAIRSAQLTFTLVVVVRYFGGVKLGTGGLVVAYKTAAAMAIEAASVEERLVLDHRIIEVPYADADVAMRFLREGNAEITQREYSITSNFLSYQVRRSQAASLEDRLRKILSLRFVEAFPNSD